MGDGRYELGTVEASEALLIDLYIDLRRSLASWSAVTHQTPQPRMGYIGQHLTSVVTGLPGGRSGARGKDLVGPGGTHAEIKTCYRVDQLGSCNACGAVVASVEAECSGCGSGDVLRKDDSKWLISPKHDDDMRALFEPEAYYLVLFDFEDLTHPTNINARIWKVDPRGPGFAMCMVDYYFNIRANSKSGAPFNLWPFSPKFQLMGPELIYHSVVHQDDLIETLVFPGVRGEPRVYPLAPLTAWSRSRVPEAAFLALARHFGLDVTPTVGRAALLAQIEEVRQRDQWSDNEVADVLAEAWYGPLVGGREAWLPNGSGA